MTVEQDTNPEVCEVISKAINILEEEGWTKTNYWREGYCAVGAIYKAAGYQDHKYKNRPDGMKLELVSNTLIEVAKHLPETYLYMDTSWGRLTSYNDESKTKKKDIIKVFKDTLKDCQ